MEPMTDQPTEYPEIWGSISGACMAVAMVFWIFSDILFANAIITKNVSSLAGAENLKQSGTGILFFAIPVGAIYIKRLIQMGLEWRRSDGTDD